MHYLYHGSNVAWIQQVQHLPGRHFIPNLNTKDQTEQHQKKRFASRFIVLGEPLGHRVSQGSEYTDNHHHGGGEGSFKEYGGLGEE